MPLPGGTIAIMQPTYLPWIGYFAMIDRVDEFVFLDSVQFEHRSWQQRNRIKTASGPAWINVPAQIKGNRDTLISDIQIADREKFLQKNIGAIRHSYEKAPFFKEHGEPLFTLLETASVKGIGPLNIALITWLCGVFGIVTPLLQSSGLGASGKKATLLADICRTRGSKDYLSAPGSKDYIDASDDFDKAGIAVHYHVYDHPVYPQLYPPFEPYMSAIDLLFNCGPDSLKILRSGVSS